MIPIDTTTGLQAGPEPHGVSEVVVGYLVTLADGYEVRFGPGQTQASNYATRQRARSIEPMYVKRPAP